MIRRVGIPRVLFFHERRRLWTTFFRELGVEAVLSAETSGRILEESCRLSDNETCVAMKLVAGHVRDLEQRCDAIFFPRVTTGRRGYFQCPRFLIAPYIARLVCGNGLPVLIPNFDPNHLVAGLSLLRLGLSLTGRPLKTIRALRRAYAADQLPASEDSAIGDPGGGEHRLRLLVVSHPYVLHDRLLGGRVIELLNARGVALIDANTMPIARGSSPFRWDTMDRHWRVITDAARDRGRVHGVVQITCLGCGCDSILAEQIRYRFSPAELPFLNLTIDEHDSDAGITTRVEAFLDTMERRDGHSKVHFSSLR